MSTPAIRATLDLLSTLPLLVAGVLADHAHHAVAPDHLALVAHRLDAGKDLHRASFWRAGPHIDAAAATGRSGRSDRAGLSRPAGPVVDRPPAPADSGARPQNGQRPTLAAGPSPNQTVPHGERMA